MGVRERACEKKKCKEQERVFGVLNLHTCVCMCVCVCEKKTRRFKGETLSCSLRFFFPHALSRTHIQTQTLKHTHTFSGGKMVTVKNMRMSKTCKHMLILLRVFCLPHRDRELSPPPTLLSPPSPFTPSSLSCACFTRSFSFTRSLHSRSCENESERKRAHASKHTHTHTHR